jgi:hypothetical protein
MEDEMGSIPYPIDPHRQTIHDLQIFIASYIQEGYLVFLFMDGNQDYLHVFREQEYDGKCCTPLGFHYEKTIDGSIASMVDACDLVNIHKHKHVHTPPTQTSGSTHIYFIFVSFTDAEFIIRCGILDFNTLLSSDHRPLYIDNDILRLLGYLVHETIRALECDLKLNDPRLIDAYQTKLIQQLLNHNFGPRVNAIYSVDPSSWAPHHESRFNAIYRDVERAMHCAASNYRCKYFKKNTWTVTFTPIIYHIPFWRLQRRIIENGPRCGQQQMPSYYALQSYLHSYTIQDTPSVQVCFTTQYCLSRSLFPVVHKIAHSATLEFARYLPSHHFSQHRPTSLTANNTAFLKQSANVMAPSIDEAVNMFYRLERTAGVNQ